MLFRENKNDKSPELRTQVQRNPRIQPMSAYDPRNPAGPHPHLRGYGIPPGVAARVAAMGGYGIPPGVAANIANMAGYGIPPGVAARVAAMGAYGIPPGVAARVAAMGGFGEVDQNGDWIPGTDPTNWNTQTTNFVSTDPNQGYVNPGGTPYVPAGGGGVIVPPPAAGGSGGAGQTDWSKLFTAGEQLATGVVNAIVQGSHPAAGTSCPTGYQFVAKAGTCMTPAAYAAWLQTSAGSGSSVPTTALLLGGLAIGAVLLMKRKPAGALSGYSRRRRRRSRR